MSLSSILTEIAPASVVELAVFGEFRFPGKTDLVVSFGDRFTIYSVRPENTPVLR
jgi:hypothetical protein